MSRYLLASTAFLALAASTQTARAEDITTKKTTPLRTSTIKNGAADTITITTDGSVVLTGGTAVTMDSDHAVSNAGTIDVSNGTAGIVALAGTSGNIVNSGTITVDEPYAPADDDNDGDLDGPFALGANRYGIRTEGAHGGNISNSGKITVVGNDSAGISLGGPLTGDFTHNGETAVTGDRSVGIEAGAIDGDVRLAGSVSARGEDAVGAHFSGDVDGAMVVQGNVAATGYRYTTVPSDPSKLDADDLLQGGSALLIEGNVSGGIVLAVPPGDADPDNADEDADGIPDNEEGSAKVVSYGAAPAMVIGATDHAVAIGPVAGTASGYGLQIDGAIEGRGLYSGVDATGLAIAGRGGEVTIANGIGIGGTVMAVSNGGSATAVRIGAGASTPELRNSGTISASGGNAASARTTALHVAAGASLPTIRNSGTIKAVAGADGTATAILDESGSVTLLENSGAITASGAAAASGRNVAIDLSAATQDLTVRQTQVASGYDAPSISGDVRLGSGNDLLAIADGSLTGDVTFGGGDDRLALSGDAVQTGKVTFGGGADTMTLEGSSSFSGTLDFGGGADSLTLAGTSAFGGSLLNASQASVKVSGGALDIRMPTQVGSLEIGENGVLVATLDAANGQGSAYTVGGTASFAEGAKLAIRLADVSTAEGSYQVLTASAIEGLDKLETVTDLVPFMFKAELDEGAADNTIVVDVARRSIGELGLNRSQASAYDAVFAALSTDEEIEDVFLSITDGGTFRDAVGQMLPDHAGGAFEGISLGVRTLARQLQDPPTPLGHEGKIATTVNLAFWGSDKKAGPTAAYDLSGYAWSLGGEYETGLGYFGATVSYLWNRHTIGAASEVKSGSVEGAVHWRGHWGAFGGFARASIGHADFDSERKFTGVTADKEIKRTIDGSWNGSFVTFVAGASAEGGTQFFFFRPQVSVDYVRLREDGYAETGDDALGLVVDKRTSDEFGLNGGMTVGFDLMGMNARDENWMRIETEGGWREVLGGSLGATTARLGTGDVAPGEAFTLSPEGSTSGWFGRLRAFGGSVGFIMGGELSADRRHGEVNLALRGSVTVRW
ncbi:autotransporter outer membrane beta-barrel domain-containing protein [Novosphingobium mangrovi (ex Huang et al. 2023)]|uniref:Autotransporter outer membrane beta-barrel domain-containing protein n=1 Tax=Novosphingobium mangrovi (ex Huang et al. 2023) TaxID=2976432 RepID=A0ABT2I0Y4_9SPHN|nr:autotransporter outer membrane beta-barrel domain-containing protein [Novosphingobium mangrovi (ex Huang et al. 2023)]MCT2398454.1 autotransporter outer membrane beta-barrel domain-containing protein [Novosphingobium mangrovi (ex Huang et al. 2023)]